MSDLQIGLLVIGAAAVAGVLIYNRVQERAVRREAQRAFGSRHADVLLEEPARRREPTLGATAPRVSPPAGAAMQPRIDYTVDLQGVTAAAVRAEWAALDHRFAGRTSLLESEAGRLRAALQMVSRSGVISEPELLEFRSRVEALAAAHGASVAAPEVGAALEAARELDRACADVDVQIALHVLGVSDPPMKNQPFQSTQRPDGVTLLLDVPRTPDLLRSYEAMVRAARQLGGRIVDDNGNPLDERALGAIGAEVEALHARLAELRIEPGSPLALRLFS
jgi:ZipA-like protein with FtsZ-binding domain